MMGLYQISEVDNRDPQQMYGYLEDRIEVMKRRITELERENENLRLLLCAESTISSGYLKTA